MISFAQNHEDVLLARCFPGRDSGFYIDIGAWDPVVDSVTNHFYQLGWHGVNVEPVARYYEKLLAERPRDMNLCCAVSDEVGTMPFVDVHGTGLSAISPDPAQRERLRESGYELEETTVPTVTLAALCKENVPQETDIDFLKIDAEGSEDRVVKGADWERYRPRVVVVETVVEIPSTTAGSTRPPIPHEGEAGWEKALLSNGFLKAGFDGLNAWYVRSEDADLSERLSAPVNVLDGYEPYALVSARDDLIESRLELERTRAWLGGELAECGRKLSDARGGIEEMSKVIKNLSGALDAANREIVSLQSSTSWRLTAPLRKVGALLKR